MSKYSNTDHVVKIPTKEDIEKMCQKTDDTSNQPNKEDTKQNYNTDYNNIGETTQNQPDYNYSGLYQSQANNSHAGITLKQLKEFEKTCDARYRIENGTKAYILYKIKRAFKNQFRFHRKRTIFLLIILCYILFNKGKDLYQNHMDQKQLTSLGIEFDEQEYLDSLKKQDSDIKDMTLYDKYEMGLQLSNGSDSDYDGLTDKEEIETYHTDPLKSSTAGDLYTDGYKVQHSMDVNKAYEYEGEQVFKYNECPEVKLTAELPTDFYTVVKDETNRYKLDDFGVFNAYKGYNIYNYNGKVSINVEDAVPIGKLENSKIEINIFEGNFITTMTDKPVKPNFTVDGTTVNIDFDFDHTKEYHVFFSEKKSFKDSIKYFFMRKKIDAESIMPIETDSSYGTALIYGSPMLGQFFGVSGHVIYDENENEAFVKAAEDYAENHIICSHKKFDKDKIVATDELSLKTKIAFFKHSILSMFIVNGKDKGHWWNMFYVVHIYQGNPEEEKIAIGDTTELDDKEIERRYIYKREHTNFSMYVDELPFKNFGSDFNKGGNCAGITEYTAYVYNKGKYPASGSYDGISWDLSKDKKNKTLMDKKIYSYKGRDFLEGKVDRDGVIINENLTNGEREFVKMIGAAWTENTNTVKMNDYLRSNGEMLSWDVEKKINWYLDHDKVVQVDLLLKNGTGHAIILYDYYFNKDGETIYRVYDSNAPQDESSIKKMYQGFYLACKKEIAEDGSETFVYIYSPFVENIKYWSTSFYDMQKLQCFVAYDEDYKVLNEKTVVNK